MAEIVNGDILAVFEKSPGAVPLYEALAARLLALYPDTEIRAAKTQVSFFDGHMYACASLAPVRPRAQRPPVFMTVSFPLARPLDDPRALAVPVRANRWTHHVIVGQPAEIDEQLLAWIAEARALARRKTRK